MHAALILVLALAEPAAASSDISIPATVSIGDLTIVKKAVRDARYALGKDEHAGAREAVRAALEEGRFFTSVEPSGGAYVLSLDVRKAKTEFIDMSALQTRKSRVLVTGEIGWRWTKGDALVAEGTFTGTGTSETPRMTHTHANVRSYGVVDIGGHLATDDPARADFTGAWEDFFRQAVRESFISTYDSGKFP